MRLAAPFVAHIFIILTVVLILGAAVPAQNASRETPPSVTVPFALDQGRLVIDVDLLLPDGSTERVRAWVDNGNPALTMNRRVANLMGLSVSCEGQVCVGRPKSKDGSLEIKIGEMKVFLSQLGENISEIRIPASASALAPGMSAEINLPTSLLRNYDVLIDFPGRKFTIGLPGTLRFNGVKSKMLVNPSNGLIQIPSKIENKNYDLGLDLGSSANFLSEELFDKLSSAHPDWPHMTGAVGPFNTGELEDEPGWKLMRLDRVQYGPLFLTDLAVADLPGNRRSLLERRVGAAAGLLGSEALMNYRVGLDYAHSTVFFDIGRTVRFPDFDVVGLILRPETENGFTIAAVAGFDGKASVPDVQPGDRPHRGR